MVQTYLFKYKLICKNTTKIHPFKSKLISKTPHKHSNRSLPSLVMKCGRRKKVHAAQWIVEIGALLRLTLKFELRKFYFLSSSSFRNRGSCVFSACM